MDEQGECLTAVYEVQGPEANARSLAQRVCLDQMIEAEPDLLRRRLHEVLEPSLAHDASDRREDRDRPNFRPDEGSG